MIKKRLLATAIILLMTSLSFPVKAADSLLTRTAAQKLAIQNSNDYQKLESELALKEVELTQAVKNIKLKKKNMSTFRWSPLINFKLPEKANLEEEYEFTFKPIQLESEINVLKHQLSDQKLADQEKVNQVYTRIVVAGKYLEYYKERLQELETRTERTKLAVKTGNAAQSHVEALEEKIKTIKEKQIAEESKLIAAKKELSDICDMDVTTGYRFEEGMAWINLSRSQLPGLIQNTLDKDASFYETSMTVVTEKISLETNYRLMENQYGDKMNYVSDYVKTALEGQKIDSKAFKQKYDEFLKAIDEPWQGNIKILFLKIPKEWFKGEISGIRYVEDSSYSLFEAALSYLDAILEKENQQKELEGRIESEYNNLVSLRKAYDTAQSSLKKSKNELEKNGILYRLGEMSQEEYLSLLDEHEELQIEQLEALSEYSNGLYAYDRLTCGGITELLMTAKAQGSSVEAVYAQGAYYYLESLIQNEEFRLSISLPVDFPIDITDFELWCNNRQIGERTSIEESLRHLKLALSDVEEVKIRFYSDDEFIDDCLINPENNSGPLKIIQQYKSNSKTGAIVGSYSYTNNNITGLITLNLETEPIENIGYYRILNKNGKPLGQKEKLPIKQGLQYLGLLAGSLEELEIEFYDKEENLLYKGYFDTVNSKLKKEDTTE
ncbi:MAG: hypothetical protein IKW28_08210 [Lachnospiraceae bacterium]|nr:hypothetical protein [Lachnospiraceae bacterium]